MVITTMVGMVTTTGIHHKLFATLVMAPAIPARLSISMKRQEPNRGGSGSRGKTILYFDYHPNYGKGNQKWRITKFVTEAGSNTKGTIGILVIGLQVSRLFLAHQFDRIHTTRMNKLLTVHPQHYQKLQM